MGDVLSRAPMHTPHEIRISTYIVVFPLSKETSAHVALYLPLGYKCTGASHRQVRSSGCVGVVESSRWQPQLPAHTVSRSLIVSIFIMFCFFNWSYEWIEIHNSDIELLATQIIGVHGTLYSDTNSVYRRIPCTACPLQRHTGDRPQWYNVSSFIVGFTGQGVYADGFPYQS